MNLRSFLNRSCVIVAALTGVLGVPCVSAALVDQRPHEVASGAEVPAAPGVREAQISSLEAAVEAEPDRPGLQLDLAIALCQAGELERAQRLLLLLDSRPDLPTGIAEVISWYRRSKLCREDGARVWYAPQGFMAVGLGHHQNLNLGPLSERISVSGLGQELELAASSRPQAAVGAQAEVGLSWGLGKASRGLSQWTLSLYGIGQRFEQLPMFGLNGLHVLLGRKQSNGQEVQTETLLGSAQLTLGDGTRLAAQTAHAARHWPVGDRAHLGASVTLNWIDYAQRAALDARQTEARLRWTQEGASWRLSSALGWLDDRQRRDRPGGDRKGPLLTLNGAWAHLSGLSLEGQWRAGITTDDQPYAPALFGSVNRRTIAQSFQTVARQRLGGRWTIRFDARWSRSNDRLALFSHRAHSVVLWLESSVGEDRAD